MPDDTDTDATARVQVSLEPLDVAALDAAIERLDGASERLGRAVAAYAAIGRARQPATVQIYIDGRLTDTLSTTDANEATARIRRQVADVVFRVNTETDQADAAESKAARGG